MKVPIYNQKGEEVKRIELPKEIFGLEMNADLVHQVILSQTSNRRKSIAHSKDRGEVSGGGRKPWAQKGLGRARHGSTRSPIWRHGGVTFGPRKEKIFKKKIPKKMKRKALFMALSAKAKSHLILLLDDLKIKEPKTKLMAGLIEGLRKKIEGFGRGRLLIALPGMDRDIIRASRNIAGVETVQAKDLNLLDVLSSKYLLLPEESIKVLRKTFL